MRNLKSYLVAFAVLFLFALPSWAQNLRIYHIDVEQGEATLFISPSGQSLLVDSGKNGHGARIKAIMQQAGITRIDHFVNTHYHEDHYGGVDELANDPEVNIGAVYDRGDKNHLPSSKLSETRFQEYQGTVGQHAQHLTRGMTIPLDPTLSVTCISSGGAVLTEEPPVPAVHENDMSVSLLIQYGSFRYFIGGDIELTTEGKIAARDLVLDVDVYQANHHGSHTSSSLAFMQDLSPTAIIISNGNHGGFRHPRQHTLDTYAGLIPSPTVFQTNKYLKGGTGGNVPDNFIADLESTDTDGTILLSVNQTAGNYTVSYRTQSHSFQIKNRDGSATTVVIESLLPNPVGSDRELEEVTLRNNGSSAVSMAGWRLQDESGRVWPLVSLGTLAAGQSATIRRNGMPMSLNNPGDEIVLLDANDSERDRFRYTGSTQGTVIQTGH